MFRCRHVPYKLGPAAVWMAAIMWASGCGPARNESPTIALRASASEVEVGDQVVVDGSGSTDPDGDPLLFRWTSTAPPDSTVAVGDPRTPSVSFTPDVAGAYQVSLNIDDGEFDAATRSVTIEATGRPAPTTKPPRANAGPNQSAEVGEEVVLDGTASTDPDTEAAKLGYTWTVDSQPDGSNVAISAGTSPTARFTPTDGGLYEINLEVSDGDHLDTDTVSISVESTVTSRCVLISEYIEGGNNKAVELYNCDNGSIDLSNFRVCIVSNANTSCTNSDLALSGSLGAGEVFTLCNDQIDGANFDPATCDRQDRLVNFNGNDRLIVYADTDQTGSWTDGDMPADVFGEIANAPSSEAVWGDVALRRCNFDRFDGASSFDYTDFYTNVGFVDLSGLGKPPTGGCSP